MTADVCDLLLVVPARGGSKGLPGKNLRTVAGHSLVARAVRTGLAWMATHQPTTARILVDTDDAAIAAEGVDSGAWVPFLREAAFAEDATTTADSVIRLLDRLVELGHAPAHVMLLQPTSPLRTVDDLSACWSAYEKSGHSALTVVALDHPWEKALRPAADGTLAWAAGVPPAFLRRQDFAPAFFENGAVYCLGVDLLRRTRRFLHEGHTVTVPMPRLRSIDVDDLEDLLLADAIASLRLNT